MIDAEAQTVERMKKRIAELEAELEEHGRDTVTGLPTRRVLDRAHERMLTRSMRSKEPLAVLVIDLDGLKTVNDTEGHRAGDTALRCVGDFLLAIVRTPDFVGRYGGDEFVVLLEGCSLDVAAKRAETIRAAIEHLRPPVTASIGVSWVIDRADAAMYEAKAAGKNQVRVKE